MASKDRHVSRQQLGAVIVNFQTAPDTLLCIESLNQYKILSSASKIFVVDNLSGDDSVAIIRDQAPGVRLVESKTNNGFGSGVNQGIECADTDFVLVLNPDTRFIDGKSIDHALAYFNDPAVGVVGLNLKNPDGSDQNAARTFYSLATVIVRRLTSARRFQLARDLEDQHFMLGSSDDDAPWVIGAGFIVRREHFAAIGGMDERFFLYMEDVDLCRRMWRAGYKVKIARDAILMHYHRRESGTAPLSRRSLEHLRSLLRYTAKYGLPLFGHDKI